MNKRNLRVHSQRIRFKHFSRKGYSLFSVLGREVIICTLAVSTLQNAKAEGVSTNAEAADDNVAHKSLQLDEVTVTGSRAPLTQSEAAKLVSIISRDDIDRAAVESINDVLKLATGVDVRQRGGYGVQTDISLRGGNFDQITILLNGVNISSPHTGHLTADFPISPDDIERIEVIEGASSRVYGASAFNGVVNIVTRKAPFLSQATSFPPEGVRKLALGGEVGTEGGSYGYFGANGRITLSQGALHSHALSAGYSRSDGATSNSAFTNTRLFYQGDMHTDALRMNWQAGYSYKPYEANTFYGASSTDQWESNERWMAAINADITLGHIHLLPQAYFNRWYDHYQWHHGSPVGENYHRVEAKGASLNAWTQWALGKTSLGVEVRDERILSTKLGKPLPESEWKPTGGHDRDADKYYKFRDQRCDVSLFLEHDVILRQWTMSLGLLAEMNDGLDTRWRFYPGVDISYRPTEAWRLYASWNMALRMPTFTDLYYSGANIEGNSNLKPEKTTDLQIGARYSAMGFVGEVQAFYSHKTDMIDWVTYSVAQPDGTTATDGIFHSVNFQTNHLGYELNMQFLAREVWGKACPLRSLGVQYSYISEDSRYDVAVISSKYAMDYLRHKVVVSADGTLWRQLNLGLDWRWQDRVGNGNAPYALLDGKLSWDAPRYSLHVSATNILAKRYFDYVSIPQPGFCIMAGAKLRF